MRVLRFRLAGHTGSTILDGADPLERLLVEWRMRRRLLRLESQRLAISLRRIRILARRMRRSRASLRQSRLRVQVARNSILPIRAAV